jgi:hypothetical protein
MHPHSAPQEQEIANPHYKGLVYSFWTTVGAGALTMIAYNNYNSTELAALHCTEGYGRVSSWPPECMALFTVAENWNRTILPAMLVAVIAGIALFGYIGRTLSWRASITRQ